MAKILKIVVVSYPVQEKVDLISQYSGGFYLVMCFENFIRYTGSDIVIFSSSKKICTIEVEIICHQILLIEISAVM
jgi:hypothetical protein